MFKHRWVIFLFIVPPQVKYQKRELYFSQLNQNIELEAVVDCGSPALFTYTWTLGEQTLLSTPDITAKSSKYTFTGAAASTEALYEIVCTVTNSIESTRVQETQTRFALSYRKEGLSEQVYFETRSKPYVRLIRFGFQRADNVAARAEHAGAAR